ncbi:penicillin-binding protein 2 [Flexibacter flexilis DSM 6793]|uniref:Penicillin-binding protein 2 n=1 Tax=Flexibacter flexilis DSM 6793 TaxID=927664 RepID=A0A1I1GTQ9_9BACT|nr:penicillin-binding protein 2 [Flexibacter flexilis]SFC12430.1 penicillin-binding protein 2 [Flexibacter flexilis DSM 6793]
MLTEGRKYIVQGVFVLVGLVFLIKLFFLQIIDDTYKQAADENALQKMVDYPYRGLIYDRDGKIMVYNVPVYDVMVTPREVRKDMDTLGFCNLLKITKEEYIKYMRSAKIHSSVKPTPFIKQLSHTDFASIQDQLVDYPGFFIMPRTVRSYPNHSMASALGYIGEISRRRLERDTTGYYKIGDYIGISGLEGEYESYLRGRKGVKYMLVDVHGIQKGSFKDGAFDTTAVRGENLYSSIDLELQKYCEKVMQNKAGSIVAIEPSTGEILAFVSAPTYDPELLTAREFPKNYSRLQKDSMKPLFNRPLMAPYPPGSIFKTIQALIGLQEGVIDSTTIYPCVQNVVHCHPHPSPCNLRQSLQWSCNPYYLNVYRRIINQNRSRNTFTDTRLGYEKWREYVESFGLGQQLGVDLPNEKKGILRKATYFDRVYGENRWKYSNLYSMSIGQGEIGMNPLQMANLAAILANRGFYYTPHFIRKMGDNGKIAPEFTQRHTTKVEPKYFDVIANGMMDAVRNGTIWSKARMQSVVICGKTGTAQNPQGDDHSVFIGFAPKDNPKIAVAVFVENAGFGGFVAAPIGSLVIEKYLKDTIIRKNLDIHMTGQDFIHPKKPKVATVQDANKTKSEKTATNSNNIPLITNPIGNNGGTQTRRTDSTEY